MNVLVLNCGSSSLKFQLVETDVDLMASDADTCKARGVVERIGSQALITLNAEGQPQRKLATALRDQGAALDFILRNLVLQPGAALPGISTLSDIHAIGHRVVHGGEKFKKSMLIDTEVLKGIEECIELAPLHNPANLGGIRAARSLFGEGLPQVAVFDTSFHSSMPEEAYLYPIPYPLYRRHKIRRYGFHGTSHRYVAHRYRQLEGKEREATNIITVHLGNGCSACAIKAGSSVDTSMGFTPLEGLVMGTRSGDVDPSILEFLAHKEGMSLAEVDLLLNKQSGLLGLSGLTNDMRELLDEEREHGDRRARLAIDIFCYRVKKYVGAYLAALGGAESLVFTGGIGENSAEIRRRICNELEWFGIALEPEANVAMTGGKEGVVSTAASRVKVYVIPTNEELLIARDTVRCVKAVPRRW